MKVAVLGAGPAGLTVANRLLQNGVSNFLVIEKEKEAGGLCRSEIIDESPFDIGGGHFLDVRRPKVNEFLFQFMSKSEWNIFSRDSQICLNEQYISHPIEANIWQMSIDEQVEYLKSIAVAGCNQNIDMPKRFVDWIQWKLGNKISNDYMLPYNAKMFGKELNELGTYWLEKLPNVSFEDTLRSCLERKPFGKQPGHAQFYYPKKYGYGELWKRMGDNLTGNIVYNKKIISIDVNERMIHCSDGSKYQADLIISTIPWKSFDLMGAPKSVKDNIAKLKNTAIVTRYYAENMDSTAHWIYYPQEDVSYHRILLRHNFCNNSRGYWTETNADRYKKEDGEKSFYNEYAYPLNTLDKPELMSNILEWSKKNRIYGLGRWGEHQHYNSDVTVERALSFADDLLKNK